MALCKQLLARNREKQQGTTAGDAHRDLDGNGTMRLRASARAAITAMQAADHRDGNDIALVGRLDLARRRAVVVERMMATCIVVIVEIGREDCLEMTFVEHDEVIEAVAA